MPRKYVIPRDQQMNARTTLQDKITIEENGYTAGDGLAFFADELRNSNPRKKVAIQRRMIDIQLDNLKRKECEIQSEIELLESKRASLNEFKSNNSAIDLIEKVRKNEDVMLPPNLREAITRVQYAFDSKRDLFVSSKKSSKEIILEFMEKNDDFILATYNSQGSGLDWRDFKELLLSEVVV